MAVRDFNLPPDRPERPRLLPPRQPARWKRVTTWILGIFALLILVAGIGIAILLRSQSFHNYILRTAQQQASDALNTRVQLQNFAIHPATLGLDLYGLTVYGSGPGANRPLLQVDHVGLGVRVISVLRRQWNLDNVAVDHPVVNLIVDRAGQNNIPTPKPSSSQSSTNIFDLAIRHILLNRGEVYYNDRKSLLSADLRDLTLQSSYDNTDNGRYFGNLSYRDGHLQYGAYSPIPHDFQTQFDIRRTRTQLSNAVLKSGASQLRLDASLANYSNPTVHAKYSVSLDAGQFRDVLKNSSLPGGTILSEGTADYVSVAGKPLLDTTTIQGTMTSSLLQVRTPSLRTEVRDLSASYNLANGNAEVKDLRARILGGELTGNATVRDLSGKAEGHVVAAVRGISLADVKTLANSASLRPVVISGRGNADAVADWTGNMHDLVARANATATANVSPRQQKTAVGAIPVNAVIHARYANATGEIALNQSYVRTAQTSIDANGTVSRRSALQVRVESNDLHELETIADAFRPPAAGTPAQPLGLYGTASFNGTVRGSVDAPQIAGQLSANGVKLRGSAFRLLRTNVQASPSLISLQNGVLEPAGQGRATFSVQSALHQWSYTPSSPFTLNLNASQLSVAELARAANASVPVTGTLNANVTAHGTQLNPVGQGDINLRNASVSGEPIQLADVRFQGTGETVHANLKVQSAAGSAQSEVTYYPKQQGYDAVLRATDIHLERIKTLRDRNLQLSGTMNLTASGRGTLQNPQGQASLTIPQLNVQQQTISNIDFKGNVANHEANFTLNSAVSNTPLRAQGKVALTGDYYADANLDTPVVPLQPLLATYAPAQAANLSGQTEIHASLRGPLKNKALLQAHLNIPTLAVNYHAAASATSGPVNVQIGAVAPIRADYANGVLELQPGEIKGTATDVHFQGRIPLNSNGPSTLGVTGSVDLTLAQMFDPDVTSGGQLQFDIHAAGQKSNQDVEGQIRIVNARFAMADAPVGLSNGNGVLTLHRDRIDITQFTGQVGGGPVSASGGVTYRPAVQFYVGLKGNDMRLLYPPTVRTGLGMNVVMSGNLDAAVLQGQVNINSVSFTPDFDLSSFIAQFDSVSTPAPSQGFQGNLKLNIAVRSASELRASSQQVSVEGDANLHVIGTASNPVIVGRANLTGGDLIFLGNRYVIQGGTIAFVNAVETRPVVNLQVNTTVQQYNIAMRFQGPLDRLHTNYTSDPALPPADIIHLLAFGTTEEAANAAPAQSSTLGAEGLVASQVTSQITNRVQKVAGISQLSVDPVLQQNGNQSPGARITVQQRVTSKLFVTFATDVTQTTNQQVQMEYHLNRKWSVSGVRDQNGGFGIDGRYHKDF